jgi:ABC-type Na+ efflux pump permease subunit
MKRVSKLAATTIAALGILCWTADDAAAKSRRAAASEAVEEASMKVRAAEGVEAAVLAPEDFDKASLALAEARRYLAKKQYKKAEESARQASMSAHSAQTKSVAERDRRARAERDRLERERREAAEKAKAKKGGKTPVKKRP